MNKMAQMIVMSFVICFFSGCSKSANVEASTMPDDCGNGDGGKIICATTHGSIAEKAYAYTGKIVLVSGFLVIDNGVLTLYQDENSYVHGMFRDAVIEIGGSEDEQKELFEDHGYRYVTISGYFRAAEYGANTRYYLGEIRGDIIVNDLPTRGVADRQGWEDITINVKDLKSAKGR